MTTTSLHEAFGSLADPRQAWGRRHPLAAILTHVTVAMLAGARSLEAIAQFGRDRGAAFAAAVGYRRDDLPCKATFHNVLKVLPAGVFEAALRSWLHSRRGAGWRSLSVDGKTLRGATGEQLPGVHLLAAYAHDAQEAVAQMRVDGKTNEHKAALELLDMLPLEGKLVLGDPRGRRSVSGIYRRKSSKKRRLSLAGQGQSADAQAGDSEAHRAGDVGAASWRGRGGAGVGRRFSGLRLGR